MNRALPQKQATEAGGRQLVRGEKIDRRWTVSREVIDMCIRKLQRGENLHLTVRLEDYECLRDLHVRFFSPTE